MSSQAPSKKYHFLSASQVLETIDVYPSRGLSRKDCHRVHGGSAGHGRRHHPGTVGDESGIRDADISPDIEKRFELSESDGVIVLNIRTGSKAARAGMDTRAVLTKYMVYPIGSGSLF